MLDNRDFNRHALVSEFKREGSFCLLQGGGFHYRAACDGCFFS